MMRGALTGLPQETLQQLLTAQTWAQAGVLAGDSEFKVFLDTLKQLNVPHSMDWAPGRGNGKIGKNDVLQDELCARGHNFTVLAMSGVDIGPVCFLFFSGGSGDKREDGMFICTINRNTGEIKHRTDDRRVVCREE